MEKNLEALKKEIGIGMEQQVQEEARFANELNSVNAFINKLSTTSRCQLQSLKKKHTSMTRRLDWEVPQTNLSAHKTEATAIEEEEEESPRQDADHETVSTRTTSSGKSKVQSEGNPRPKAMKENQVENQVEGQSSRVVRKAKRGKHVSS